MLPRFELANAIRVLSMDAVQQAKSGHPGVPKHQSIQSMATRLAQRPLLAHWVEA